jgi:hypothetical protein
MHLREIKNHALHQPKRDDHMVLYLELFPLPGRLLACAKRTATGSRGVKTNGQQLSCSLAVLEPIRQDAQR